MGSIVLGIAGGTASGKSTVAEAVARRLGDRCLLVSHDRYYRSLSEEHRSAPETWNFDHPRALDTERMVADVDALRAGRSALLPVYDFATHSRLPESRHDRVEPREILVVEGILVLAEPELRERFDRSVYVHTADDLRLLRRIRRDRLERGREVDDILAQYLRTVRPMHEAFVAPSRAHADLVVDGAAPVAAAVGAILGLLGEEPEVRR